MTHLSFHLLHHPLVGCINTLVCSYLHRGPCYLLQAHLSMFQQGFCCTLGKHTSTSHSNHVLYLNHIPCPIQLHNQFLVDHYKSGLKMPQLLTCPPLLGIADAAFQSLLGVLFHDLI